MATLNAWIVNAWGKPQCPHAWLHTDLYLVEREVQTLSSLLALAVPGETAHLMPMSVW